MAEGPSENQRFARFAVPRSSWRSVGIQYIDESVPDTKPKSPSKRRSLMFFALAAILILLILAASWAPDSRMTQLRWVPAWAGDLADRDPNFRTAIPFIPLAFLLVHGFAWSGAKWSLAWSIMICGLFLGVSEFGQNFLARRTADGTDLMWGGIGILIGTGIAWISSHWRRS